MLVLAWLSGAIPYIVAWQLETIIFIVINCTPPSSLQCQPNPSYDKPDKPLPSSSSAPSPLPPLPVYKKPTTHLDVELPEASTPCDPQEMLQTLLEFQKSMIEKQLQCVTHHNKPLPPSTFLLPSEYPRSSEHPTPSKHPLPSTPSSSPPEYSLFLKIYKELDRLLNQLRGWEDVFQKCLSDYTTTGDVDFGNDFMKGVRENQKGVQNLVDESFKHEFESSFLAGVGHISSWRHSRHTRIYKYSSALRRQQLKMDRLKERRLLRITGHFLRTCGKVLSRMLSTSQPFVKRLELKQNELKMVSPAHVQGMERVMERVKMGMEMMIIERGMIEMERMEMEVEMTEMKMDMPMTTITPGTEQFGASKKLAKVDALDCVHLIREYHAVMWEQIRTLCFLPLWFVNKEELDESEKRRLESLERNLTDIMADLDRILVVI